MEFLALLLNFCQTFAFFVCLFHTCFNFPPSATLNNQRTIQYLVICRRALGKTSSYDLIESRKASLRHDSAAVYRSKQSGVLFECTTTCSFCAGTCSHDRYMPMQTSSENFLPDICRRRDTTAPLAKVTRLSALGAYEN